MSYKTLIMGMVLFSALAFSDQNENFPVPPTGFDVMQNNIPHGKVTLSLN